jgi:hypothetical protein
LAWVLMAFCAVRLLSTRDPRWWLGVGAALGIGMLSKYAIAFFATGLLVGVLATDLRRDLRSRWLWLAVAVAFVIFLPNFLWQVRHGFVTLDFLKHIHARDVRLGRTRDFIPGQLKITLFGAPLALAGLYFCFRAVAGRAFRLVGWMYCATFALFVIGKGRDYYLGPAYPVLYAAGAVLLERWSARLRPLARGWLSAAAAVALAAGIAVGCALTLPLASVNSAWGKIAFSINGDFQEEIGWPELVQTIAQLRDSLPPPEHARVGIVATNYGEAGAVNLYGPQYGLPPAISGVNTFWLRTYPAAPPEPLIVIGLSRETAEHHFEGCRVVAHTWNTFGVQNEETRYHPDIFLCRGPRLSWPNFWRDFRYYG